MKKIISSLVVGSMFLASFAVVGTVGASTSQCGDPSQSTPSITYVACGNGPIVPQIPGGRFLRAGEEDCPSWFPSMFGHACYTMRPLGAFFYPLN